MAAIQPQIEDDPRPAQEPLRGITEDYRHARAMNCMRPGSEAPSSPLHPHRNNVYDGFCASRRSGGKPCIPVPTSALFSRPQASFLLLRYSRPHLGRAEGTKDLTIDQKQVADFAVPESDLKVTAWVDRKDDTYQAGDTLKLFVKANRDAYVTVVDVGTSGKVLVLFPNKHASDNRILADKVLQIPDPRRPMTSALTDPPDKSSSKSSPRRAPARSSAQTNFRSLVPFRAMADQPKVSRKISRSS